VAVTPWSSVESAEVGPPVTQDLIDHLKIYDRLTYRTAKNDFVLPQRRLHRFTGREVVLSSYVTIELARRIRSISKSADEECERSLWDHFHSKAAREGLVR